MFYESSLLQTNLLNCFLESEDIDPEIKKKLTALAIERTRTMLDPQSHINIKNDALMADGYHVRSAGIFEGLSKEQVVELKSKSMGYESVSHYQHNHES